jgi:hypothetical protein
MSNSAGDKKYIDNLFKALSVHDALNIFAEIDKQILRLLDCSSEDFLSLNNHFKSYHKESKAIAQNASNIIQIIIDSQLNSSFNNLKSFGNSFNQLTKLFSQHVELLDVEIKKTCNKYEHLKLIFHNYRQNLASLKMLLANLNIDDLPSENKEFVITRKNNIEKKIESIKQLLFDTDSLVNQFNSNASESYVLLNNIKKENYQHLQKLNDNIEFSFNLFSKKYNEASDLFPALKELTEKNSSNIAKIITNLQYHDIIRQKIEHIQRTHQDITADLISFTEQEPSQALLHNKAKTFLKIRDIAGLQAAQLLHANKQYQMAIEEIGINLEEIGNEMITISSQCDNLVGKSAQTKDYYLNNIVENLNNALNYNNTLSDFITNIKKQTQQLSDKNKEFGQKYSEIASFKDAIKADISELSQKIDSKPSFAKDNKILPQLSILIKEIDGIEKQVNELHIELSDKVENLLNPKESFQAESNMLKSLNELSHTIPNLINLLKENIQKIDELLYSNSTTSNNISDNILTSLKKIKYYELFEKTCEKIVEDLNSVNLKLNTGDENSSQNKAENLQYLKERYTMASEHIIHDQITRGAGDESAKDDANETINADNQNSESDDDNLELF